MRLYRFLAGACAGALLTLAPAAAPAVAGPGCESCHEQGGKLAGSAHRALACAECHPGHDRQPHRGLAATSCAACHGSIAAEHAASIHGQALRKGNASAPACGTCHGDVHDTAGARTAAFRKAVPETCGMCHDGVAQQFQASVHGQALARGVLGAAVCTDCHGEHSIQAPGTRTALVHPSHVRETCAQCHGNVRLSRKFGLPADRVVSFDASFHGLAAKAGSQTVANCASCHGVHNILASADPQSMIHPRNLPSTCGACHQGAGSRFALGPVHLWPGRTEPASVTWVRRAYQVLIPGLIGLMLLYNLGDWLRKVRHLRFSRPLGSPARVPRPREFRMYPFERVQHALLVVSFIVLAFTGFQLTYPDEWWARPAAALERSWSVRGWVHRGAAVVFLATALAHAISLVASRRLRTHWKELWPRASDAGDALRGLLYNLGLRSKQPHFAPYSFVEKAEYWAVVWGAVIMGATGVLLWADNWILARFPKELLDFATALHFYEAVLACLAIAVWHLYVVIFDPDVYPMDTAWLGGFSVRKHSEEAREATRSRW